MAGETEKQAATSPSRKTPPRASSSPTGNQPTATSGPLDADPNLADTYEDDLDSDAGSVVQSTVSLTDSIRDFRNIHGRTFSNAKTTEYWGPNDEAQTQGLDVTHHYLLLYFDNELAQAPIGDEPQNVLDLGTGTGSWAIDFADQYPSSKVIGTDISPIQSPWVPPNCEFQIDDMQLDWTWPDDHFDYIHIRDLYGGIADWATIYNRAFAHLKPGGWFEHLELDIKTRSDVVAHDPNHIFNQWNDVFSEAGKKMGKTLAIAEGTDMADHLANAGFVNRQEKRFRLPMKDWCRDPKLKEIGNFVHLFIDSGLEGFALYMLTQVMGWKYEECQVFVAKMRRAVNDPRLHAYYNLTLVYGQKPE